MNNKYEQIEPSEEEVDEMWANWVDDNTPCQQNCPHLSGCMCLHFNDVCNEY